MSQDTPPRQLGSGDESVQSLLPKVVCDRQARGAITISRRLHSFTKLRLTHETRLENPYGFMRVSLAPQLKLRGPQPTPLIASPDGSNDGGPYEKKSQVIASFAVVAMGLLGALACSSAGDTTGSSSEAISEINCAYRTISAPTSGAVTSDWEMACGGISETSPDGTYGYTNCTHGYIWEVTELDNNGVCGGRIIDVAVKPGSIPSDQTDCEDTRVTFYLYGLDTVNDIQYAYSSSVSGQACTWGSGGFGCLCQAQITGVDLDNWPNGTDGAVVSVDGIRVVGQAYNSNVGNYVKVEEQISEHDYGTCCVPGHH
jgi:hypothetical protein